VCVCCVCVCCVCVCVVCVCVCVVCVVCHCVVCVVCVVCCVFCLLCIKLSLSFTPLFHVSVLFSWVPPTPILKAGEKTCIANWLYSSVFHGDCWLKKVTFLCDIANKTNVTAKCALILLCILYSSLKKSQKACQNGGHFSQKNVPLCFFNIYHKL
jgi:hypothetical protein